MGDGLKRANAAARASRYDRERAKDALAATARRDRCWAQVDSETWSYVPRSWQWRATVTAQAGMCAWKFFSLDGAQALGGGHSADLTAVRRAVKAGPARDARHETAP